jgi:alcohol dehydrogenase, propanol-preferring
MVDRVMQAWVVDHPGPVDGEHHPLVRVERPVPEPRTGEVRVRVRACGVCRTDLHLAEGDLEPRRARVTPGHEVVGVVDRLGPGSTRWQEGDRIGVP